MLIYPDGDKVSYKCNTGGLLTHRSNHLKAQYDFQTVKLGELYEA